jgi:hypothetical protein
MTGADRSSSVRHRSRSARERSKSLRVTSQQLRESLENLRAYAAEVHGGLPEHHRPTAGSGAAEGPPALPRTPLDFAGLMQERVLKARSHARALRSRAADLRNQAAEFRARSEDLRSNSARI